MKEISNRTLVILFIIAIFTAISGLLAILIKIGFGFGQITGFAASAIGTVNVTVSSTVGIRFIGPTNMSFGSGTLYGDGTTTYMNSTISITNPDGFNEPFPFQLENSGNVMANISVNGTTAASFLGGTEPWFAVNATNVEGNATLLGLVFPANPVNVTSALSFVVNNTNASDSNDLFNITVFLGIPQDTTPATKNATITFWAVASIP